MIDKETVDFLAEIGDEEELNQNLGNVNDTRYTNIFSSLRGNLVEWFPFAKSDNVLIVGKDYGALAGVVATKVKTVTSIDWNQESFYVACARKKENIDIKFLEFSDIEKLIGNTRYNYIILAHPLILENHTEIENTNAFSQLNSLKKYLANDGVLVFFSGNSMGMKYLSGVKDETTDDFFSSIEDYSKNEKYRMPSQYEIKKIIEFLGLPYVKKYYPYPDYIFPTSIYSEDFMPEQGELSKNAFSWQDRIILFNEMAAFNNVIKNEKFDFMCNAYLVVLSNKKINNFNLFTKYSNDRSPEFSIRTDIKFKKGSGYDICKIACSEKSKSHVKKMRDWYSILYGIYSDININKCKDIEGGLSFEHIEGKSLLNILYDCLQNDDYDNFERIVLEFSNILNQQQLDEFEITPQFKHVFGEVELPQGLKAGKISNIDLIFSNILVDEKIWHMIDYEWVFDFPIPVNFILYRSIFSFFHGPRACTNFNILYQSQILEKLGIDDVQWEEYRKMEDSFQRYVCGKRVPLREMGTKKPYQFGHDKVRCFFDYGDGFKKINSFVITSRNKGKNIGNYAFGVTSRMKRIRIDPCESRCLLVINHVYGQGVEQEELPFIVKNGICIGEKIYFCNNVDPQIIVNSVPDRTMRIECEFEVTTLSQDIAEALSRQVIESEEYVNGL